MPTMPATVVGLVGPRQSGKDTFARFLVEEHGYTSFAFADVLRDVLLDADPVVFIDLGEAVPLSYVVGRYGWDTAKERYPDVRGALQSFGVAVRNNLGEDTWVRALASRVAASSADRVVITDARFPNEAAEVRHMGGLVVRLSRPDRAPSPGDSHISETGLDAIPTDLALENSGTLDDLRATADRLAAFVKSHS